MELTHAQLDKNKIRKSVHKIQGNDIIAEYYKELFEETGFAENKAEAVKSCLKVWDVDYYRLQKVKDVLRVNLCHDKFCPNCQNLLSLRRYAKYKPELDKLLETYSIYHVVFTVPNCSGIKLKTTLKNMYAKFIYVVQYMQGKRKAKNIDFKKYGFVGAVRSLEITLSKDEFHPHFHCLFVMRKDFTEKRKYINDYSYHNGKLKRKFTDFEILLQKCWFLFYNGQKLTKKAFDELTEGYSVFAERANGNYKEVFKYATKGLYNPKTGSFEYPYEVFKTLYDGLHRRKIIQGYGILNKLTFEDEITKEEKDNLYLEIKNKLQELEDPFRQYMALSELCREFDERDDITYISKNNIRENIKDL